jgi:hypothetical protein
MWLLALHLSHAALLEALPPVALHPDAHTTLRLGLALHVRADADLPAAPTARLARLRVSPSASLLDGRVAIRTQLELTPGKPELVDAFVDGELHPGVRLRAGWTKIPLSRYRSQSVLQLAGVDWDRQSKVFGGERQLGVMVHDAWRPGFTWAAGVFAGINSRASHGLGVSRQRGTAVTSPSSLTAPQPLQPPHPELVARLGWRHAGLHPMRQLGQGHDAVEVYAGLGVAWDLRPAPAVDHTARLAGGLAVQWRGLFQWRGLWVDAVAHVGWTDDLVQTGLLTEMGARVHRHLGLSASASMLHERGHPVDVETTVGVEVPLLGHHLEWSADAVADQDGVGLRSQIQVAL